jgi:hypothetical protein
VGWLSVDWGTRYPSGGSSWADSLFGGPSMGWYWTDHLKTEIDAGAGTTASAYASEPLVINGRTSYSFIDSSVTRRAAGISQHYQFFRNAWFHPYVGAGATITWQRVTERIGPVFIYDEASRTSRVVSPERREGPHTQVLWRPHVGTGFKAYMTQRAFFRSDLRVSLGHGVEDLAVRFGFGVDF